MIQDTDHQIAPEHRKDRPLLLNVAQRRLRRSPRCFYRCFFFIFYFFLPSTEQQSVTQTPTETSAAGLSPPLFVFFIHTLRGRSVSSSVTNSLSPPPSLSLGIHLCVS